MTIPKSSTSIPMLTEIVIPGLVEPEGLIKQPAAPLQTIRRSRILVAGLTGPIRSQQASSCYPAVLGHCQAFASNSTSP